MNRHISNCFHITMISLFTAIQLVGFNAEADEKKSLSIQLPDVVATACPSYGETDSSVREEIERWSKTLTPLSACQKESYKVYVQNHFPEFSFNLACDPKTHFIMRYLGFALRDQL